MIKRTAIAATTLALFCSCIGIEAHAQTSATSDPLLQGFENPPNSARPRVWWHWMNGNISQQGIKLDLDWMHSAGLAGFQTFDAALETPQVVPHRLVYMTPEWKDAFRYATNIADQLGMEEAIAGSPGWSETGGPWVPASQGMKKYVWSETDVAGGKPFTGTLQHPPTNTGAFQDMEIHDELSAPEGAKPIPHYYADSVVLAYRRAATDVPFESLHPKMTASGGSPDAAMLVDGDVQKATSLPIPAPGANAWIQYEFPKPETMRAITIVTQRVGGIAALLSGISNPEQTLQASDDGQTFRDIVKIPDS
ncbi:MAG TPA: glycosyl hydrolase [Acidobacteriaceae bacterium]